MPLPSQSRPQFSTPEEPHNFIMHFWLSLFYTSILNASIEIYINDTHRKKTCALFNSVQKFIEIEGWLLLTFFICLHNQLSSFNSIIVQMSEKRDLSNRQ